MIGTQTDALPDATGEAVIDPLAKGGEVMTTVVKWSPFRELDSMERRMRRMFEELGVAPALVPATDVYETDEEFVVELEVPGFEEKELGITLTARQLVVKGERTETKEQKEKTFRLHERLEREFERRFALPPDADLEHVEAKFAKGVLEVHAPKLKGSTPKKVTIAKA
jgi:HSP20 family protein